MKRERLRQVLRRLEAKRFRRRYFSRLRARARRRGTTPSSSKAHRLNLASGRVIVAGQQRLVVRAPSRFCLRGRNEAGVEFLNALLEQLSAKKHIYVDVSTVREIDLEAAVSLFAVLKRFTKAGLNFGGNYPRRKRVTEWMLRSGVLRALNVRYIGLDASRFTSKNGFFRTSGVRPAEDLSARSIEDASLHVWGEVRRCTQVHNALIELMTNTSHHASSASDERTEWWLCVEHVEGEKRSRFCVLDLGIGIIESLRRRDDWRQTVSKLTEPISKRELLTRILNGRIRRSNLPHDHRGQGLFSLKESMDFGAFANLFLLSNNLVVDDPSLTAHKIQTEFSGTIVSFEINEGSNSLPAEIE